MNKPRSLKAALEHLATAARNGKRAKARLAAALAKLPTDELRKVNPKFFAALGTSGMQLFAEARGNSDVGLRPATKPVVKPRKLPLVRRLLARPWVKGIFAALVCVLAGVATERTGGFALDAGFFEPRQTYQGWPVCHRLDLANEGCVYRTTSDRLTIEQIMAVTGLGPEIIVEANPHVDFRYRLPLGTLLVVPGTLNL